jgi:hypothetical protein
MCCDDARLIEEKLDWLAMKSLGRLPTAFQANTTSVTYLFVPLVVVLRRGHIGYAARDPRTYGRVVPSQLTISFGSGMRLLPYPLDLSYCSFAR